MRWISLLLFGVLAVASARWMQPREVLANKVSETTSEPQAAGDAEALPGPVSPTTSTSKTHDASRERAVRPASIPPMKTEVTQPEPTPSELGRVAPINGVAPINEEAAPDLVPLPEEVGADSAPTEIVEPVAEIEEEAPQPKDNKWIESLSGLNLQKNHEKKPEPYCDEIRCPLPERKSVTVFGVVHDWETESDGRLHQGSFIEKTPAFYIK